MQDEQISDSNMSQRLQIWGARFSSGPAPQLVALSKSTQFDWKLAVYDLQASMAHAQALAQAEVLTADELAQMINGLQSLYTQVQAGQLQPNPEDEDVHTALERELIAIIGPQLGGKLRAGRSRNDQIATLIRLYMRDHASKISALVRDIALVLVEKAEQAGEFIMPGRTHMQHAQPVLVAHHLLAHVWPLLRNLQRIADWSCRVDACPYGAGALAGNSLEMDAQAIAEQLQFTRICENSIDATSSRDLVAELLYVLTQVGIDISRLAEEIIIWNTKEFGYVSLHDAFSTGSSIMPQKKNPDIAELARGKAGRLLGNITGLLATLKALPLAYNRDLQEDKEPLFDSVEQLEVLLPAMSGMIATLKFNYEQMQSWAPKGHALATDVAEWLVRQGVSFREAHELAGQCVQVAETKGIDIADLSEDDFIAVDSRLTADVRSVLSAVGSVQSRNGVGGTAPVRVAQQLEQARQMLLKFLN